MSRDNADRPPNLLFLYTDEQTWRTLAAYGNDRIEMPNLDAFARTATVFDQAYCTQPVCTPSRSSILTGLYPHANGCTSNNIALDARFACLPERLPPGRARTAHYGKWHLGDEVFTQHGFDDWRSTEDGYEEFYSPGRDSEARSTYHRWLIENGLRPKNGSAFTRAEAARLPEEFGKPAYLAGEASRFLRENRDRPFALYVNFLEPHMPFFGPRDDQYDPAAIPLPANFEWPRANQPLRARVFAHAYYEKGMSGLPLKTEADWRRMIANYWGLCSLIDTHVGRILDTLAELGLDENTIVVFTSDHGDMMGSHRLLAKAIMFQEAIRVPLLVRLPGQRAARRVSGPVSLVDLVPTLLDLMGAPVPDGLHGQSLRPVLEPGGPETVARAAVVEWNGPNTGVVGEDENAYRVPEALKGSVTSEQLARHALDPVRTLLTPDGWRFSLSTLGENELYNLNDDPGELRNLAAEPAQAARIAELTARLRAWQAATGDGP